MHRQIFNLRLPKGDKEQLNLYKLIFNNLSSSAQEFVWTSVRAGHRHKQDLVDRWQFQSISDNSQNMSSLKASSHQT